MISRNAIMLVLLAGAAGAGCGQAPPPNPPAPDGTAERMTVQPGDVLRVAVWPDDELGGEFAVEGSGHAYLPLIGEVRSAGVPMEQLREELRARYRGVMKNAVVTVTPVFRVGVLGQVQRPGLYMVTPTHTLFDVIGMAGGFRPQAEEERVRLVRRDGVVEIDALRALRNGDGLHAVTLRSGDQIVVPVRQDGFRLSDVRNVMFLFQSIAVAVTLVDRLR